MSDLASLLNIVSALAVLAGLVFAGVQLREMQRQRTADSVLQLMQSLRTPEFADGMMALFELPDDLSWKDVQAKLGPRTVNVVALMLSLESVGILVKKREVSLELACDFFYGPTQMAWRKLHRAIREIRAEARMQSPLEYLQYLAEAMQRQKNSHSRVKAEAK